VIGVDTLQSIQLIPVQSVEVIQSQCGLEL